MLAGALSAAAVQSEFLESFEAGAEVPGSVTQEEFLRYCAAFSLCTPNQAEFVAIMQGK